MRNRQPQYRPSRPARFALAFALGLLAATQAGIAQPPEAPPAPSPELMLDYAQWVKPDLLLVWYALRNTGTKSVIVAQHPGVSLSMTCLAQDGGMILGALGGVAACIPDGDFLELKPGQALLGKEVVEVPEGCARDITVQGDFWTLSAEAWDLPARRITYRSKPLVTDRD